MYQNKYTLEPYTGPNTKKTCPACNQKRVFTRYIDVDSQEYIDESVGICNRFDKCGYHKTPYQFISENGILIKPIAIVKLNIKTRNVQIDESQLTIVPIEIFKKYLNDWKDNNFSKFLITNFGLEAANKLAIEYNLTSSNEKPGANIFWQVDINNEIRGGKIMLYEESTGKRQNWITWVHTVHKLPNFKLKQCFFGEHLLLKFPNTPVAIVESDKTAVIMRYFMPEYLWLSTSGKYGLNKERCQVLKGRIVVLFPDLSNQDAKVKCYSLWQDVAIEISKIAKVKVSSYLERHASDQDRENGLDIADFFLQNYFDELGQVKPVETNEGWYKIEDEYVSFDFTKFEEIVTEITTVIPNWDIEIAALEEFFQTATLPITPIKLDHATTILYVKEFICSHFETIKYNNGVFTFRPYLDRLIALKELLKGHY